MHRSHLAALGFLVWIASTFCSAQPPSKETASLLAILSARENDLWAAFQNKDVAGFKRLVTDDYLNVDFGGGVMTAPEFLATIPRITVVDFKLSDFRLLQPTPTTAILVNRAVARFITSKGTPVAVTLTSSTVWVKRQGDWLASFYQETPVPKK